MFNADLSFGKLYEKTFLDYLSFDEYDEIEVCPDCCFVEWDICLKKANQITKYEIKTDRRARDTGNLCIEFECNGRPSGISTTNSDYYGYFVVGKKDDCYIIPTKVIREECAKPFVRTVVCGDGYRVRAYLLPVHLFSQYKTERKRY